MLEVYKVWQKLYTWASYTRISEIAAPKIRILGCNKNILAFGLFLKIVITDENLQKIKLGILQLFHQYYCVDQYLHDVAL